MNESDNKSPKRSKEETSKENPYNIRLNQGNTIQHRTFLASRHIPEFGDVITTRFEHREYKCLVNDVITELKLEIRDEYNKKISNSLPINCVLEII